MSHINLDYETKIMSEDFAKLPELPGNFSQTIDQALSCTRRLFYKRKGNYAEYHCTHCGADYIYRVGAGSEDIYQYHPYHKIPVDMEYDTCLRCGTRALLKPKRKWRYDYTWNYFYVWQAIEGGMVVRYFEVRKKDRIDDKEDIYQRECMRIFFYMGKVRSYLKYMEYSYYPDTGRESWRHSQRLKGFYSGYAVGDPEEIYKATPLKYCPLDGLMQIFDKMYFSTSENETYIRLLATYCRCPQVEMEVKFGITELVKHHIQKVGVDGKINKKKKKPDEIYKIYPDRVKELKNISYTRFTLLQEEKKKGIRYSEEDMTFLEKNCHYRSHIDTLLKYMSIEQLRNRIEKYKNEKDGYKGGDYDVYSHYADYIGLREELGYDMTNSVFVYPKNLKKSHDRMVKEKNDRKNKLRIKEVTGKFVEIPKKYKALNRKYGFESSGYIIRPAKDAAEIVREGWALHHCVGGDNYLRKHNDGKTAILFMRSAKTPDKAYVTIEVQEGIILQWYGAHDKKNVTKNAQKCIDEFMEYIKKKPKRSKEPERLRIAG